MAKKDKGRLFIVPTPIGNLEDITLRALRILKEVDLIAAEDTRVTYKLLQKYEIKTPMISYHKFNERERTARILDLIASGGDVAIVSDAGTPGISDPAYIIIREAITQGYHVCTLPGPTALIAAMVSSGFNPDSFYFVGFIPEKESLIRKLFDQLRTVRVPLIFYEAPHRLLDFLTLLRSNWGNREIAIAREISKIHESVYRGTLDELIAYPDRLNLKGEFVIVVAGYIPHEISENEILEKITFYLDQGCTLKETVKKISESCQVGKNRIYRLGLKIKKTNC